MAFQFNVDRLIASVVQYPATLNNVVSLCMQSDVSPRSVDNSASGDDDSTQPMSDIDKKKDQTESVSLYNLFVIR